MEFKKEQSIYLQIVDFVHENILSGKFEEGEKITSVREMAGEIGVNPNTVMRSYTHLQEADIIYNKRGIGFFVAKDAAKNIKKNLRHHFLKKELPQIIKKMKMLEIDMAEIEKIYEKTT